jgi:hypothetical protein
MLSGPLPMVTLASKVVATLLRIFSLPSYTALGLITAFSAISLIAFLPNAALIGDFLASTEATWPQKFGFITQLYFSLDSHMHPLSIVSSVVIAILLGINTTLLLFYIRSRRQSGNNKLGHTAGLLGIIIGIFGIGCAACGSLIIISLLSTIGAAGILVALPFSGAEFSILAVVLLSLSVVNLAKRIQDPLICPVSN